MAITKLWGGRFQAETNKTVEEFTASITFDRTLALEDIVGSLAHVKMLAKSSIINSADMLQISAGLQDIYQQLIAGDMDFKIADEDIHMNIERALLQKIGAVAGKLHTARSRNDQIALDLRLYLRTKIITLVNRLIQLQQSLVMQAEQHITVIMPGYTHLQRAQPILFSHHLLAYVAMLQRDIERLQSSWPRLNQLPLGAGALAGTGFPIDRQYVAELLSFEGICENSLDAVSDRDFIIEFLANASLIMLHLSRFSEELIFWSSQEFAFIELADEFCTGSSIMPQKKNPDVPELVRGKTGRVYGSLFNLLTILKSLPLAYNKDLQEDKEPLFDTVNTLQNVLTIFPQMIASMIVYSDKMLAATRAGFINATDLADYLVRQGLPFREAHAVVGKIIQYAIQNQLDLEKISLAELQKFSELIKADVYDTLAMDTVVNARHSYGGTAQSQVLNQLQQAKLQLSIHQQWISSKENMTTHYLLQKLLR